MQTVITLKLDTRLKNALQEMAARKFMSLSGYLKSAAEKQLLADGVDWRKGPEKKTKRK
jgi:predicted transcriptional regulator